MVELVQDGGGVLPGVAGGVEAAGGVVGVAEAGERVGFRYGKASLDTERGSAWTRRVDHAARCAPGMGF